MNVSKWIRALVGAVAFLPLLAAAQNWQIGIGGSYRNFKDVDFNLGHLRLLLNDSQPLLQVYNENLIKNSAPGYVQLVDQVHGTTTDVDLQNSLAPVISAEIPTGWSKEPCRLDFIGNFQWYNVDVSGNSRATQHQYFFQNGVLAPQPMDPQGSPFDGRIRSRFDMNMYELDLGLKLLCSSSNNVDWFLAAGPTLSVTDTSAYTRETVSQSGVGSTRLRQKYQKTDVIAGAYLSAGGEYWFNERYGISLEARYDKAFEQVNLVNAKLDISGISGQAKFIVRF